MFDSFSLNLRAVYARTWVRVRSQVREPYWLAADIVIPILTVAAYVFLYRVTGSANYAGFAIIGGAMLAFWDNVLWLMAAQFFWEKETGNLEIYLTAPISRMAILLGMSLGSLVNTSLRASIIILGGIFLFQIPVAINDPVAVLLVFFFTLTSLYALGMLFASLYMLYGREAWQTNEVLQEPVHLLTGFYFPSVGRSSPFPISIQLVASLIPLTIGLDGIRRSMILGEGLSTLLLHVAALIVFTLVLMPIARYALSFMERLAKKEGRLTLRWQ